MKIKTNIKIAILVVSSVIAFFLVGCVETQKTNPKMPPYFVDVGTINTNIRTAEQIAQPIAPLVPGYGGLISPTIDFAGGLVMLVSGWIAAYKNRQWRKEQEQAADLLAATVMQGNLKSNAMSIASGTQAVKTVAQHLDNNTL